MAEEELQNEDMWDFEGAEARPPVRGRRAIVSVSFTPEDFRRVSEAARDAGMRLSEYIRIAALNGIGINTSRPVVSAGTLGNYGLFVDPSYGEPTKAISAATFIEEPSPAA